VYAGRFKEVLNGYSQYRTMMVVGEKAVSVALSLLRLISRVHSDFDTFAHARHGMNKIGFI
jgi:hypothetical protein